MILVWLLGAFVFFAPSSLCSGVVLIATCSSLVEGLNTILSLPSLTINRLSYHSMSDNDDYLSAKFLANPTETATAPKTYSQLRREASKKSREKNASNQRKSKRQRELISREEGLNKSLFEKAQEEEAGNGPGNKALAMMMKMGFTPGQSLGRQAENLGNEGLLRKSSSPPQHKTEPLPINEWMGMCAVDLKTIYAAQVNFREERYRDYKASSFPECPWSNHKNGEDGRRIDQKIVPRSYKARVRGTQGRGWTRYVHHRPLSVSSCESTCQDRHSWRVRLLMKKLVKRYVNGYIWSTRMLISKWPILAQCLAAGSK